MFGAIIPAGVKRQLKRRMPGRYPAYCPICDTRHAEFWPFGRPLRAAALCPECHGLERHRLLWLFLHRYADFERRHLRLLHFAPEPDLGSRLAAARLVDYVSADLQGQRAPSVLTDITAMGFATASFDAVICSHVLEHVAQDRAAMRECRRVLRPNGWMTVQVPMGDGPTDEDPSILDPAIREQRFGQDDHVRFYGPDIVGRLQEAGFDVSVFPPRSVLTAADGDVGIRGTEPPILFCRNRS